MAVLVLLATMLYGTVVCLVAAVMVRVVIDRVEDEVVGMVIVSVVIDNAE